MHRGFPVLAISIVIYYVLSFISGVIHGLIDPGLRLNETFALTIAGLYNVIYFIFIGFLAAYLYKGEQKNIAAIAGITLVVLNFFEFIIFADELPFALRMLKVVIPLHAAMVGGAIKRKYVKEAIKKPVPS